MRKWRAKVESKQLYFSVENIEYFLSYQYTTEPNKGADTRICGNLFRFILVKCVMSVVLVRCLDHERNGMFRHFNFLLVRRTKHVYFRMRHDIINNRRRFKMRFARGNGYRPAKKHAGRTRELFRRPARNSAGKMRFEPPPL